MPNRLDDYTELTADGQGCSVTFSLRLARPPQGESGSATITFHDGAAGTSQQPNLSNTPAVSNPVDCGDSACRIQVTPVPNWDSVAGVADLETEIVKS
ncbi:MAG: hypothetical protein D6702_10825 [Planctomycetota bacterium]|nr:MAG: hypothetical protein D6702_10825 [Planctomycetota bacterium]